MDIEKIKDLRRILSRIETEIKNKSDVIRLGRSFPEETMASISFMDGSCKVSVDEIILNKKQASEIVSIILEANNTNYINDIKKLIQYSNSEGYMLKYDADIHHDSLESACADINNEYNNIMEGEL